MAKLSSRYQRSVVWHLARIGILSPWSSCKFHLNMWGLQRPWCCFQSLVLGPQFWSLLPKSSLIPRRKRKSHEDTVQPLWTTPRITLSFTVLRPCLRMRSISRKLVWELWLYVLVGVPWVALGLRAVEDFYKPVSIHVLCTCSLGTWLTSYCQVRHHEWFTSLDWIWTLLVWGTGYTFPWPSWSLSAFYCSCHCFLTIIFPVPLEIQTTLIVSQEECQGWCPSGLCICQMMVAITTRSSLFPCQLLKDWKKQTVPFGLII